MESIIEFIQELIDRDFAYENGGDVFYRTRKFDDYGKLSQQNLDVGGECKKIVRLFFAWLSRASNHCFHEY